MGTMHMASNYRLTVQDHSGKSAEGWTLHVHLEVSAFLWIYL